LERDDGIRSLAGLERLDGIGEMGRMDLKRAWSEFKEMDEMDIARD
jgi:hypothetical protein